MEQQTFTRDELVAFGSYLLSDERTNRIASNYNDGDNVSLQERLKEVYHADIENFKEKLMSESSGHPVD